MQKVTIICSGTKYNLFNRVMALREAGVPIIVCWYGRYKNSTYIIKNLADVITRYGEGRTRSTINLIFRACDETVARLILDDVTCVND